MLPRLLRCVHINNWRLNQYFIVLFSITTISFSYKHILCHLAVNITCFVQSNTLNNFPSKFHLGFTINLTSNVFPLDVLENLNFYIIKYLTNSLSEFTFSNISELESTVQDSLPVYLYPYVHYP